MSLSSVEPGEDFFGEDLPSTYNPDNLSGPRKIKGGQKTKKKPNFTPDSRKYWESLGYYVEDMQAYQQVGMGVYVQKDFIGSFDLMATKPSHNPILVQICAKSSVGTHLRKMLGGDVMKDGRTRRACFDWYVGQLGWKAVIHWFDQPGGFGTRRINGIEEVTTNVVHTVDSGRRTLRVTK